QSRSIMSGSRWMTTLRKLPTSRENRNTTPTNTTGEAAARRSIIAGALRGGAPFRETGAGLPSPVARGARSHGGALRPRWIARRADARGRPWCPPSDHRAHLEDRQVHRHDEAADEDAQDRHDHGFEQAAQVVDRVVHV